METIKTTIIKFCEERGRASKTQICDYLRDINGTTGDCSSRRIRELVAEGVLRKDQREFDGKKYFEYSVVEEKTAEELVDESLEQAHRDWLVEQDSLNL